MAKIILEEQPEFVVLPPDSIIDLKVEEANVVEAQGRNGSWQKVEFKFKVLGIQATGDGSPVENYDTVITSTIYGSCSARLTDSPENKLRQWCEAIFQMPLEVGFELDTDMLIGRAVRGVTSQYQTKAGSDRHQVNALLPKSGTAPASVPQPTAATQGSAPQPVTAGAAKDPWASFPQPQDPPF